MKYKLKDGVNFKMVSKKALMKYDFLLEDDCEYCDGRYATAKHNLNILQNGSDDNE